MSNIVHNVGLSWIGQTGQQPLSGSVALTGNIEQNIAASVAANAPTALSIAWTNSKLRDVFVSSDQNLTLYTNGVSQVNTATVVAGSGITGNGNAVVIVTAAGMTGSPLSVSVPVTTALTTASQVAAVIRTALAANSNIAGFFGVSGGGANVVLTALAPAANDATMNIDVDNGTCSGLTDEPTSSATTSGVAPQDAIAITAAQPFCWYFGSGVNNPFSGNVTGTVWANAGGTAANLSVRTLETQ